MNARQSAALATLALLAACGGDSTGPKAKLTSDEAVALAMALNSQVSTVGMTESSTANRLPSSNGISFSAAPINSSLDVSVPCPRGGTNHLTLSLTAQVDPETQSMTADMTGVQKPSACGFDAKNVVVHITGTPSLTHTSHMSITSGQPSGIWTNTLKGSFDFSTSDNRSGSCTVDWTTEMMFATHRVKIDGTFCGASFHYEGPLPEAGVA